MMGTSNRYLQVAIEAARKSGLCIKRSVGKVRRVSYKGRDNIVTDVDKASERIVMRTIRAAFPGHAILSEESPALLTGSPYKWIIDPIDGTTNFAHAFPFFCVSIGIEYRDELIAGVVYDPMRDELFHAERKGGAFLNRRRIAVSDVRRLRHSFLATGFSYGITRKDRNISHFRKLLPETMAIRRAGSAALDLCYVACGRFDGFWEMSLHPWDIAAGILLVREAGGRVTSLCGDPASPYSKNVLATNGSIHSSMLAMLNIR